MEAKRQRKIIELINNQDVVTQEELANLLIENGFAVTQATVSRDIRELNLTKVSVNGGGQKYAMPSTSNISLNSKYLRVLNDGVLTINTAENILVIKTVAGMAMAVCAALDAMKWTEIVGSIAGDDTIMCAVRSVEDTVKVMDKIRKIVL